MCSTAESLFGVFGLKASTRGRLIDCQIVSPCSGVTKITPGQIRPPDHVALLPGALSGVGRSTVAVQKNVSPEMTLIFHYSYRSISSRRANYSISERA